MFDTEIENIYLRGSFAVNAKAENFAKAEKNAYIYDTSAGFAIVAQKPCVDISNLVTDGYPFFAGEISFSTTLDYKPGDPTVLSLRGRYSTAEVSVNGKYAGVLVLSEKIELADHLVPGENKITVTLCNNYRNLLGPHHNVDPEPLAINPKTFSFEGKWRDGKCADFDGRYSFVRFGIDI